MSLEGLWTKSFAEGSKKWKNFDSMCCLRFCRNLVLSGALVWGSVGAESPEQAPILVRPERVEEIDIDPANDGWVSEAQHEACRIVSRSFSRPFSRMGAWSFSILRWS